MIEKTIVEKKQKTKNTNKKQLKKDNNNSSLKYSDLGIKKIKEEMGTYNNFISPIFDILDFKIKITKKQLTQEEKAAITKNLWQFLQAENGNPLMTTMMIDMYKEIQSCLNEDRYDDLEFLLNYAIKSSGYASGLINVIKEVRTKIEEKKIDFNLINKIISSPSMSDKVYTINIEMYNVMLDSKEKIDAIKALLQDAKTSKTLHSNDLSNKIQSIAGSPKEVAFNSFDEMVQKMIQQEEGGAPSLQQKHLENLSQAAQKVKSGDFCTECITIEEAGKGIAVFFKVTNKKEETIGTRDAYELAFNTTILNQVIKKTMSNMQSYLMEAQNLITGGEINENGVQKI